jgi:hypothetical protein
MGEMVVLAESGDVSACAVPKFSGVVETVQPEVIVSVTLIVVLALPHLAVWIWKSIVAKAPSHMAPLHRELLAALMGHAFTSTGRILAGNTTPP